MFKSTPVKSTKQFTALLLLAAFAVPASAQQNVPLRLEFHNDSTPRSSGPLPLDIEMTWGGSSLIEGRLVLSFYDGPMFLGRVVTHDMVLNVGRNQFSMQLPTLDGRYVGRQIAVRSRFITEDSEIELEDLPLRGPQSSGRTFRLLYCDPAVRGGDRALANVLRSLSFEKFWTPSEPKPATPDPANPWPKRPKIGTLADVRSPEDMPQDPHWFCGQDIVILSEAGLVELRSKQIEALTNWMRAGGSLLVEPTGGLEQRQLDFLNSLAGGEKDQFTTGPDGHLDIPESRAFEVFDVDLGCCVVSFRPLVQTDFESPEWNEVAASLWRFRSDQMAAARDTGKFEWLPYEPLLPSQQLQREHHDYYGGYYNRYEVPGWTAGDDSSNLLHKPIKSGQGLVDKLMPSEVEVVPLSVIGLILLFYVLTIGPVDYFVLGALRLRRFTWITFPAATIAFTLFTVWLSHTYLDASTEQSQVRVFDIGEDGSVLRSNVVELLFVMSSRDVEHDLKSSVFTAMSHSRFGGSFYNDYRRHNVPTEQVPPPTIHGRPPGIYQVVQEMPQWTPQLNRTFTIAPEAESLDVRPDAFDWKRSWDFDTANGRQNELASAIREAFGNDAQAWLYHQRDIHPVTGRENHSAFPITRVEFNHYQIQQQAGITQEEIQELQRLGERQVDFLTDVSVRLQGRSLFGVVSQISPHGGDNFEDMAVLDPSDADQWLLVIVDRQPEDIRVYRHLYRVTESSDSPTPAIESTN